MTRLLPTVWFDVRLQIRYGFVYAGGFVAVVWLLLLRQLSSENLEVLIPALLLQSCLVTTFYFIAALVLLEKSEGTLEALVVTPLETGEYLGSKLITLTALATAENLVISFAAYGFDFEWGWLLAGLVLVSLFYVLVGFVVIARYDSITDYLLPSGLYTLVLTLPWIDYFELWPHWVWYVIPTQAPLLLMKAAFRPIETWQLVYALAYAVISIAIAYLWAERIFQRFVVRREGGAP